MRFAAFRIRELENQFIPLLQNCVDSVELKKVHTNIIKFSLSKSNFLVTKMMDVCDYTKEVDYATLLFKQVIDPNLFLFNAMIRVYTHNHMYNQAIPVYKQMLRYPEAENSISPDKFTFPFLVKCCAGLMFHDLGKQIHAHVWKFGAKCNSVIENSLIDMYTKCDNVVDAHKVFDEMPERDVISWNSLVSGYARLGQMRKAKVMFEEMVYKSVVSWTTMISGYGRIGCYSEALDFFRRMQMEGIEPDEISIVSVLPACAQLGALEVGKWIHMYAERKGFLKQTCICNALIEMYAKCGCLDEAWKVFDKMHERDVISWSSMILGLGNHGKGTAAIELFQDMRKSKIEPNGITFLGLLSACAHAGFSNEGLKYFDSMKEDCHLKPDVEHYGCLVDLLGRLGRLSQALEVIKTMPMKPDSKIWGSLLSCCRTHGNLEIAVVALEKLQELEPDDTGNYVLLSNIYADNGKWEKVSRMRKLIRSKSTKRIPGCSSIEVNSVVQEFVSGDDSKPFSKDISFLLGMLATHKKKVEYIFEFLPDD